MLDKISAVHIPKVYQKDFIALQKYLLYLNQTEKLLPLQTRAVIILTNYRSGIFCWCVCFIAVHQFLSKLFTYMEKLKNVTAVLQNFYFNKGFMHFVFGSMLVMIYHL